jgi:hypothetical protein
MFRRLQDLLTLLSMLAPRVLAILAGVALSAQALATPPEVVTSFSGTLTTEHTFFRPQLPEDDYTLTYPAEDITAGSTRYNYFIQYLEPSVTGPYTIKVTSASGFDDTLLLIYKNSFDPLNPLTNLLVGNDDQEDTLFSRIDITLDAGTTYVLVMTTYESGVGGAVNFSATGYGAVDHSDEEPVGDSFTAPTLTATSLNPDFTEGGSAVAVFSGASASTVDSGQTFTGLGLNISNLSDGASEKVVIGGNQIALTNGNSGTFAGGGGNYSVTLAGSTATITLTSLALDAADMNQLVNGLAYLNSNANPTASTRGFFIASITDSGASNNNSTLTLTSVVQVIAVNSAPTDITLSAASINQSVPADTVVGTLSSTDADSNSFTYSLVSGTGSTDNPSFKISGNTLSTNTAAIPAGERSVRIRSTDSGSQTFDKVFTITVVDNVAPAAPTLALVSDTGASDTDGVVNLKRPGFTGTAESGSLVFLFEGASPLGTATAPDGTWTVDPIGQDLSDGPHNITARAKDAEDNVSGSSTDFLITVDTSTPSITAIAPAMGAEPADARVNFTVDSSETLYDATKEDFTLTTTGTATGNISGYASGTVTVDTISGTGTLRLDMRGTVTDLAGNAAPSFTSGAVHTVDRDAPTITGAAFDQTGVTNANATAISVTLAGAEIGATANYSISDSGSSPVTGSVTITSATQQISGIDLSALNDETLTLSLKLRDTAGNESSAVTDTIEKDVSAPIVTSVTIPDGAYSTGDVVTLSVRLNDDVNIAGSGITLALDVGGTTRNATFDGETGGVLSFVYTIQDGDSTSAGGIGVSASGIVLNGATIRDVAGNDADLTFAATSNADAQVDTDAPATPSKPVLAQGSDSAIDSDGITNIAQPSLSGTADAEVDIALSSDLDGLIGTTTTDINGAWSLTPAAALSEGTHEITAVASDDFDNASAASTALTLVIDTTLPTISGVAFDQTVLDGTTYQSASFTLSGAEVDSTAAYTISGVSGTPVTASFTVNSANQQVNGLDLSALGDGNVSLSVTLTDVAGNAAAAVTDSIVKNINPVLSLTTSPAPRVDGSPLSLADTEVSGTSSTEINVEVTTTAGTLEVNAAGGGTITGNNSATLTLNGDLTQINAALATLVHSAPADFSGDAFIDFVVDDGIGSTTGRVTATIYDRPDILGMSGSTVTYQTGGAAGTQTLLDDGDASIVDQDNPLGFDDGELIVSITTSPGMSQDQLGFETDGAVTLDPNLNAGADVLVNDGTSTEVIGFLMWTLSPGNALGIALNSNATPARLALVLQSLAYTNSAGSPIVGARTLQLSISDGAEVDAHSSINMTLNVVNPPPPPEGSNGQVIDTNQSDNHYTGTVTVTEHGVFNGGTMSGTIVNHGVVQGEVHLNGGSTIQGGTVAGNISGDANAPARIDGASVADGAALSNVIIGADTVLAPGVQIGPGVKFESIASIPPGLDFTGALPTMNWATGDARSVVLLDGDILTQSDMTLLRALQLMNDFEPSGNPLTQNLDNGEIIATTDDYRSAVVPVAVSQAGPDEAPGVYVDDNGAIVLITDNHRRVLAYPVLADSPTFEDLLAGMGLQLDFNSGADLVATPLGSEAPTAPNYFAARPMPTAVRVPDDVAEGTYSHDVPGLRGATQLTFVFRDEQGRLMEQNIVPVPADWSALKLRLGNEPGLIEPRIDTQGIISVILNGVPLHARMDYPVMRSDLVAEPGDGEAVLQQVGDLNGDGTVDFNVLYPNGDVQVLLIFP